MANKTTESAQTIASKAAAKVAENIFKKNPDIKEAYVTADGIAFYGRNDAKNHAKTLSNNEVFEFNRNSSIQKNTTKSKKAPKATDEKPESNEEVDELTGETIDEQQNIDE